MQVLKLNVPLVAFVDEQVTPTAAAAAAVAAAAAAAETATETAAAETKNYITQPHRQTYICAHK